MVSEGAWSALSPRQAAGSGYGVCGWCSAGEWRGPVARGLRGTAPGLGRAAGARLTGGEVSQWRGGGGASAQVEGGAWAPRGRERRVPLEVRVVPSCYLECVLSAPKRGRWARYRPAFPAPAPFSQPRPRPRPPAVSSSSCRLQGVQRPAPRFPRRLAAQILGPEGPQLSRAADWAPMGSEGSRCWNRLRQGRNRGERSRGRGVPTQGSSRPLPGQGSLRTGHVPARAAREGREVNVPAPPRGDQSLYPFAVPDCPQIGLPRSPQELGPGCQCPALRLQDPEGR